MGNGSKDKDPLRKNQIEMLEIKKTTTTTKKTHKKTVSRQGFQWFHQQI